MYDFLIEKKLSDKINKEKWLYFFSNCKYDEIWEELLDKKLEHSFNFIVSTRVCVEFLDFNSAYSSIESKVYKEKTNLEVNFLMIKTVEVILKNYFNEMIKTDLDIIDKKNIWVGINLDSFYFINLDHLNYDEELNKKKNPLLYKKILNINIIICTLERIRGVYFYTKLKKNKINEYPKELIENISFTKGYLICFEPYLVEELKNFKYLRKVINREPIELKQNRKKLNFIESINNENYNNPIWLNNRNLSIVDYTKNKVYNRKLINKKQKVNIFLSTLNFLNSIELEYDKEIFQKIENIINNNTNIHHTISNKTTLENIILKLNFNSEIEIIEDEKNINNLIQSASVWELIKKQLNYYKSFFLSYRMDHRLRIYCYPWPINYQLNHIVRNVIRIKYDDELEVEVIWKNFWKHPLIKKYIKKHNILDFYKNKKIKEYINNYFIENRINSKNKIEDLLKKEAFYQTIIKIAPNELKNNVDKFNFGINILKEFINSNIKESIDIEKWLKILKIKNKKISYLVNYQETLKCFKENNFKSIFWADASSNAIQLIILRLNITNNFLLKLVNIIDNDTPYSNIYEYVTEEIKKKDHREILKKINNKITVEDMNNLQDIDNNKYLLMPSSYGMGKFSYREKLENMITNDERRSIWERLEEKDKIIITDYFWDKAKEILLHVGFDIEEYKKICKSFWEENGYEIFLWKNDLNITVAPVSIKKSKRHEILKKINIFKLKYKETINKEKLEKIENNIKKLKEKLKKDDKLFWKRSMIKSNHNNIYSRIYYRDLYENDKHETRQSLVPNTIHCYDASNMHLTIQICKKIGIKVLVIHDSIGSNVLLIALVKMIFKISNILFIDLNSKRKVFPFKKNNKLDKRRLKYIKNKILKSKNFFK